MPTSPSDTTLAPQSRSLWDDARRRFRHNKAAVLSTIILILILAFAALGGLAAKFTNEEIDWGLLGNKEMGAPSIANGHYFGVDDLGRDLYARTVQGTQVSLAVATISTVIAVVIGVSLGVIAGYFGGKIEIMILRGAEIVIVIPYIMIMIVWLAILGRTIPNLLIIIGLLSWMSSTIIVRGTVRAVKHKEFIDAARLIGLNDFTIIKRHIIPNIMGIVVIDISLLVPNTILMESLVSFLGAGVQEPDTSWGALISEGAQTMQYGTIWQLIIPTLFFAITQICLFFIGDGLRDALDPKER